MVMFVCCEDIGWKVQIASSADSRCVICICVLGSKVQSQCIRVGFLAPPIHALIQTCVALGVKRYCINMLTEMRWKRPCDGVSLSLPLAWSFIWEYPERCDAPFFEWACFQMRDKVGSKVSPCACVWCSLIFNLMGFQNRCSLSLALSRSFMYMRTAGLSVLLWVI